jgi:hypothetical protein
MVATACSNDDLSVLDPAEGFGLIEVGQVMRGGIEINLFIEIAISIFC